MMTLVWCVTLNGRFEGLITGGTRKIARSKAKKLNSRYCIYGVGFKAGSKKRRVFKPKHLNTNTTTIVLL